MIYHEQGQPAPRLVSRLSGGALAINLIVGALLVGLGAVAAPVFGVAAGAAATALSFAGAAGATIGSVLLGTFVSTSSSRMVQPPNLNSYATLTDVVSHIQADFVTIWDSAKAQLQDVGFRQAVYSSYGLLQAFQVIDPKNLSDGQFDDPELCANSPLVQGITYASWQQLVPAIFSWQCMPYQAPPINARDFSPFTYMGVFLAQGNSDVGASSPTNLVELNDVFDGQDLPTLQQALYQLQLAQCQESGLKTWPSIQPGAFFCVTAASCTSSIEGSEIGAIMQQWCLVDRNGKTMDASLTEELFGVGSSPVTLNSSAEQGSVYAAWGGAWYWNTRPPLGAQATWFDVFANWGASAAGFAPATLTNPSSSFQLTARSWLTNLAVGDSPVTKSVTPQLMRITPQ